MVFGARHRIGQTVEPQLFEAGEKLLFMLAAEEPEHPLAHHVRPLPG